MVCGGLWRIACISPVSLPIIPNDGGGGLFAVVCLLVIP